MKKLGIYIHIPFCIRKCNYCDFCSYTELKNDSFLAYTKELCRRVESFAAGNDKVVDTVYFGGGTPTLLPLSCFEQLMSTLYRCFKIEADAEITAECNPATVDIDGLRALRGLGINRLSIGLQSAVDKELRALGRLHSLEDFCRIFGDARRAGFDNISLDLMYGIPEQTLQSFECTLDKVISLAPEHISAYGLKIEEGTEFFKRRRELKLPNEDSEYDMYCRCCELLEKNGYHRYEISNFAKAGKESRHNLRYWKLRDYIGFGVAAHSCINGERFGNSRDIDAFLRGEDITEERSYVTYEERRQEYVMLGLRLAEGIETDEYKRLYGRDFRHDFPDTDKFINAGFFSESKGHIAFTTKGFFVSNEILSQMLSFNNE